MSDFRFSAACEAERLVFGAQRPGYRGKCVGAEPVARWIEFMRKEGIERVCCLLAQDQLEYYERDLLAEYREHFGAANVCSATVPDYTLCELGLLEDTILPFLDESCAAGRKVVVHCSGGSGRTGHVLAAWLVRRHGMTKEEAEATLEAAGRNPREAVRGPEDEVRYGRLLEGR